MSVSTDRKHHSTSTSSSSSSSSSHEEIRSSSTSSTSIDEEELAIQQWKIKQLIKNLEGARGNGTSLISLIIPYSRDALNGINKKLQEEYGTASNIKSRVTRLSVLSAITSIQARLKLYTRMPKNGLCLFCGEVETAEGKEKKISIDFEPYKPIQSSVYLCDNKFHCESLYPLLEQDKKYGFIIMDGNGTLYGTLSGNTKNVLYKFTVDLPKKHGRGGQSSVRFSRLRVEKRNNYVRKVAEIATQQFISQDRVNVLGLIVAGSAEFKLQLIDSKLFDPRLLAVLLKTVDVSYGGENGFNQAIELSSDCLCNLRFVREKKLLTSYFSEVAKNSGLFCFGTRDTFTALEMGAVSDLYVYEDLNIQRYVVRDKENDNTEEVKYLDTTQQTALQKHLPSTRYELKESTSLVDWLSMNFKQYGTKFHLLSDKSQEGSQFAKGFGGFGGILRYKVDFASLDDKGEYNDNDVNDDDDHDGDGNDDDVFHSTTTTATKSTKSTTKSTPSASTTSLFDDADDFI